MTPRFARVLAVTDFSDTADRAIPFAWSLVAPGGEVHLVHIVEYTGVPNPLYAHATRELLHDPDLQGTDLVNTGEIQATNWAATTLPAGNRLYATIWTKVQNVWYPSESSFTTAGDSGSSGSTSVASMPSLGKLTANMVCVPP